MKIIKAEEDEKLFNQKNAEYFANNYYKRKRAHQINVYGYLSVFSSS